MARSKDFSISIALKAVDKATAPITRVNQAFSKVSDSMRRMHLDTANQSIFSRAGNELRGFGRGVAEFSSATGLTNVLASTQAIGGKLGQVFLSIKNAFGGLLGFFAKGSILLGVAGFSFYEALSGYIKRTDGLDRVSRAFGMSSQAMREWGFTAEGAGVEAESFQKMLRKLANSEALANWGVSSESLNFYNLGIKSLKGKGGKKLKGLDELMFEMAERLNPSHPSARQKAHPLDQQKKIALLKPIFGRGAYDALAILDIGKEGLQKRMADMSAISFNPTESDRKRGNSLRYAQLKAKTAFTGMTDTVMNELAPGLERVFDKFSSFWMRNRGEIKKWAEDISHRIPQAFDSLVEVLGKLGRVFQPVLSAFDALCDQFGTANTLIGILGLYLGAKVTLPLMSFGSSLLSVSKSFGFLWAEAGGLIGVMGGVLDSLVALAPAIGVVGLLGESAYLAYKHWDSLKDCLDAISDTIDRLAQKPFIKVLLESLSDTFKAFGNVADWSGSGVSTAFDSIFQKTPVISSPGFKNSSRISDFEAHPNSSSIDQDADINTILNGSKSPDPSELLQGYLRASPGSQSTSAPTKIVVEFVNTPKGTHILKRGGIPVEIRNGLSFAEVGGS